MIIGPWDHFNSPQQERISEMILTIAIPSYGREEVLLNSLSALIDLRPINCELLLVDQTPAHQPDVERQLHVWKEQGQLRWIRQTPPSITTAMNRALLEAKGEHVLFLDDDIQPDPALISAHQLAISLHPDALIAGRVLQPWHEGKPDLSGSSFNFNDLHSRQVTYFIGCNFSVPRKSAIAVGGFDQQFVHVAYRFEEEFAHRWCRAGYIIQYEPRALIHHLRAERGGTRSYGQHLRTVKPSHSVGRYYFLLRTRPLMVALGETVIALARSVSTQHHLRHPQWILITLLAELRGLIWALSLYAGGAKLLQKHEIINNQLKRSFQ